MITESIKKYYSQAQEALQNTFKVSEEELAQFGVSTNQTKIGETINSENGTEFRNDVVTETIKPLSKKQKILLKALRYSINYGFCIVDPFHIITKNFKNDLQNKYGYDWEGTTKTENKKYIFIQIMFYLWNLLTIALCFSNLYRSYTDKANKESKKIIALKIFTSSNPLLLLTLYGINIGNQLIDQITSSLIYNTEIVNQLNKPSLKKRLNTFKSSISFYSKSELNITNEQQDDNNHNDNESNNHPTRSNDQDIPVNNQANGTSGTNANNNSISLLNDPQSQQIQNTNQDLNHNNNNNPDSKKKMNNNEEEEIIEVKL